MVGNGWKVVGIKWKIVGNGWKVFEMKFKSVGNGLFKQYFNFTIDYFN